MFDKLLFKIIDAINVVLGRYALRSYSQEGEDMILRAIFGMLKKGFYVDVGAHHPVRFSNTLHFYCRGWRGINLDAKPGSMRLFRWLRPKDINLECAVALEKSLRTYYEFNDPALNGFLEDLSVRRDGQKGYRIISEKKIGTYPLAEVLERYLPEGQSIDFLSVDVEGLDMEVLKSNDWTKYRPKVVLAETLDLDLSRTDSHEIFSFLMGKGYRFYAKTIHTVFFMRQG